MAYETSCQLINTEHFAPQSSNTRLCRKTIRVHPLNSNNYTTHELKCVCVCVCLHKYRMRANKYVSQIMLMCTLGNRSTHSAQVNRTQNQLALRNVNLCE